MKINILLLQLQFCIFTLMAILLRKGMKRIPKVYSYMLWILVFARLLWPFSIDSEIGVMPEKSVVMSVVEERIHESRMQRVTSKNGVAAVQGRTKQTNQDVLPKNEKIIEEPRNYDKRPICLGIWIGGTVSILGYNLIVLKRMRKQLRHAKCIRENIFVSNVIATPFTMGMINMRIYLPEFLGEREQQYIICHEKVHIKRKDYLVKNVAFLLACINWFNPLVWVAFYFLEQDMEMSCDEEVIKTMGNGIKKEYSQSLLNFATGQNNKALTPVTFGEVSVKQRVGNVLTSKSTKKWIGIIAMMSCMLGLVAALFLCTPRTIKESSSELFSGKKVDVKAENSAFIEEWANNYCNRDVDYILDHTSKKAKGSLEQVGLLAREEGEYYFGWSSPWPMGEKNAYKIIEKTNSSAIILYYAFTSDPHYRVWRETFTYKHKGENGFQVTSETTEFFEVIATKDDFYKAYPDGKITGTPMDYLANGCGEVLNEKAIGKRAEYYKEFVKPGTSAVNLLNLATQKTKVKVFDKKDGEAYVMITFKKDNSKVTVKMVQPFGQEGIWIPQDVVE